MGRWVEDLWHWEFSWRREFFVWEEDLLCQLKGMLSRVKLSVSDDSWVSTISVDGIYTVKVGYWFLSLNFLPDTNFNMDECRSMKHLWDSFALQKATCWTLWLSRNAMIFEQKASLVSEIVDAIKRTALNWFLAKKSRAVCMEYE
ncbi:hypothetical protein TSUD_223670 [Trifolium subterraneum]|uniref:Reverse transcriptase zinc-binding domain-containing protein n=1 Tax=Trifolium subterraneum TaxID=3900 RepID=A0A2Z6MDA3_TRISU|nr:hypothetical protein TSUD_223670 [Trifolium subterraneum]